jgi:hypothetical protein
LATGADEDHFGKMLSELWRVLKRGGMLFCRLGSRIGMTFERVQGNTYVIGDGSEWFLIDEEVLLDLSEKMSSRRSPEDYDRSRLSLHDDIGTTKANLKLSDSVRLARSSRRIRRNSFRVAIASTPPLGTNL